MAQNIVHLSIIEESYLKVRKYWEYHWKCVNEEKEVSYFLIGEAQ